MKHFNETITQLIQRENARLSVRRKRQNTLKRMKAGARAARTTPAPLHPSTSLPNSSITDINRSSLLPPPPPSASSSLTNSTLLLTPQTTTSLPTATRNPISTTTKKSTAPTLTGLLTSGTTTSAPPNGPSNSYLVNEPTLARPTETTKKPAPMTGISAGLAVRTPTKKRNTNPAGQGANRSIINNDK